MCCQWRMIFYFNLKRIGSLKASGVHSKLPPTILLKQLHLVFHCHTKQIRSVVIQIKCRPLQLVARPSRVWERGRVKVPTLKPGIYLSFCRELNRNGTSFVYTLMELGVMVIYFLLLKISTNGLWRKKCSLTFT